ncbi:MAG: hypothetical protein Q8M11_15930 [Sulfuritalea sp.]|nr:hypothetical protein [Sulfuritalea sp.]MDP1983667.1 hypothetical protein [Sulfuritalea sp.]
MKLRYCCTSIVVLLGLAAPAGAQDSLRASGNASAASAGSLAVVSIATASVVVVSAHAGGTMVVESLRTVGNVVEVVFRGAANASRAVLTVTAAAASAVGLAVGQTVKVVAEGSGYLLIAAGKALAFVPGESEQQLVRSKRSN